LSASKIAASSLLNGEKSQGKLGFVFWLISKKEEMVDSK